MKAKQLYFVKFFSLVTMMLVVVGAQAMEPDRTEASSGVRRSESWFTLEDESSESIQLHFWGTFIRNGQYAQLIDRLKRLDFDRDTAGREGLLHYAREGVIPCLFYAVCNQIYALGKKFKQDGQKSDYDVHNFFKHIFQLLILVQTDIVFYVASNDKGENGRVKLVYNYIKRHIEVSIEKFCSRLRLKEGAMAQEQFDAILDSAATEVLQYALRRRLCSWVKYYRVTPGSQAARLASITDLSQYGVEVPPAEDEDRFIGEFICSDMSDGDVVRARGDGDFVEQYFETIVQKIVAEFKDAFRRNNIVTDKFFKSVQSSVLRLSREFEMPQYLETVAEVRRRFILFQQSERADSGTSTSSGTSGAVSSQVTPPRSPQLLPIKIAAVS